MINVLYIAGAGRSGSTLLERILGQIDGCVAVGELRHLWRRDPVRELCGCGRLLAVCEFWQGVTARAGISLDTNSFRNMLYLQQSVDRMRYIPMMLSERLANDNYRQAHAAYTATLRRLYEAIIEVTGCEVIVDSSKDMSTLYLLGEMDAVNIRILHMVRDSRAVAYSWTRQKIRPHTVDHVSYMDVYSPQRSGADWMYRNVLAELARGRADGYLRLRYEDLVADTRGVTRQVAGYMGLSHADLSFIDGASIHFAKDNHTVAGNPMRFEKGRVAVRLDSAWQQEFKPAHRTIVTALTWPILRRYGYR